jgi:uncharacterized repeat protein (TIGR03803 family)
VGFTLLHSFNANSGDGYDPVAELVQASDGSFYGTTEYGGANSDGTVFKVDPTGSSFSLLYSFTGTGADGSSPQAGLELAPNGTLYGTTAYGGTGDNGTVFKINVDGSGYTVLYGFSGTGAISGNPAVSLAPGSYGAVLGVTGSGGTSGIGAIFRLFTAGVIITSAQPGAGSVMLNFSGGTPTTSYNVQTTTTVGDPKSWVTIGTGTAAADGSFQFNDTGSSGQSVRFYRTAVPQ